MGATARKATGRRFDADSMRRRLKYKQPSGKRTRKRHSWEEPPWGQNPSDSLREVQKGIFALQGTQWALRRV